MKTLFNQEASCAVSAASASVRACSARTKTRWNVTFLALVVAASFAATPAARADSYAFSWSGNGITTSGVLDVTATTMPGTYQITGISGTFSDASAGISGAITGLESAPLPTYTPGSTFFSAPAFTDAGTPTAAFSYDNLLYPDGQSPAVCVEVPTFFGGVFDIYGMAFDVAGGYVADIWSQGDMGGYMVGDAIPGADVRLDAGTPVNGGIAPTPEPGSFLLLGTGLLGFAGQMVRKLKYNA